MTQGIARNNANKLKRWWGLGKGRRYLRSQTLALLAGPYENFVKQEIIYIYRLRVHSKSMHLWFSFGACVTCQQVLCLSYSEFCIPLCNLFYFCVLQENIWKIHICLCVYNSIDIQRTFSKTCNEFCRNCHGTGPGSRETVSVPYSGRDPECLPKASKSSYTRPRIIRDCSGTHKSWLLFLLFLFPHCFHL